MRNLEGRDPGSLDDDYIAIMMQVNLEAMSGQSTRTIAGHKGHTLQMIKNAERINKTPTLSPRGPFPLKDQVRMGLAVDIVQKMVHTVGRTEPTVQAETVRTLWSTFKVNCESSPVGVAESASFGKGTEQVRPSSCPTQSEWCQDFWSGLEYRMGHKLSTNHALPIGTMVKTIEVIKHNAFLAESDLKANHL